ncbi:MAG: thioredoxin family protein [Candidatus Eisenbacteria bacterium]
MRAFVFTDASLAEQAGRFVWLDIDTDKAENAAFREQFPVRALPTYLIIDPHDEQILFRWVGGASVPQLHKMLDDTRASYDRMQNEGQPASPPTNESDLDALAQADLLNGAGKTAEAADLRASGRSRSLRRLASLWSGRRGTARQLVAR